jgi:hypothetical protein
MSEKEREPDWCIVKYTHQDEPRVGQSELLVYRKYQWAPIAKHWSEKWEYLVEGIQSNEQAIEWVEKYEKLLKE